MKKIFFPIVIKMILIMASYSVSAQQGVSINTDGTTADNSAMLDIKSVSKGLLIPRMTSAQRSAITTPATGLLVYQTDSATGFYFFNGSAWMPLSSAAQGPLNGWSTTGNTGTDSTNNFIGTSDGQPLIGKVNGEQVFRFSGKMQNTIVGYQSGKNNSANQNTFYGYLAGANNSTGDGNILIGHYSGYTNTTGRQNLFLGNFSGFNNTTGSYNQFVGYQAGQYNSSGSENIFNGYQSGQSNTTGLQNYFSGMYTGNNNTTGSYNLFEGYKAGGFNTSGSQNYFSGYMAGFHNSTANDNQFIGNWAGYSNTSGTKNLFIGESAGAGTTTGSNNQFVGVQAGFSNTTGNLNHFDGYNAGFSNTSGSINMFLGGQAGYSNTVGFNNTFIGYQSGYSNISGFGNSFIGHKAGYSNGSGVYNTYLGFQSGYFNTGSGNVFIGYQAGAQETNVSNRLIISNSQTNSPLILGDFANKLLYLNADVTINGNAKFTQGANIDNSIFVKGEIMSSNPDPSNQVLMDLQNSLDDQVVMYGKINGPSVWKQETYQNATPANSTLGLRYYNGNYNDVGLRIYGSGDAELSGSLTEISDARYKKNITSLSGALGKIKQLRGVTYNWKDDQKGTNQQIGFIAQEVEKVLPELVKTNKDGYKSVAYSHIIPVLLEAIKEQQQQIDGLKKAVEELKGK